MGLFIGASILTILELFDYLYEVKCLLFSQIQHLICLKDTNTHTCVALYYYTI